jgi:hypothetical protein
MAKRGSGANMVVEMDGDAARLWNKLQRSEQRVKELEGGVDKAGRTAKRTKGFMESAFDPKRLEGFLAGTLSVGASIGTIVRMLRDVEQQAEASAENLRGMVGPLKELYQLSGGQRAVGREHEMLAKRITATTGMAEAGAAAMTMRGLSMGLTPQELLDLSQAQFFEEQPAELVERVGDLRKIFGTMVEGQSRELVNMALEAQRVSKVGAAQMMGLSTGPAQLAKALGATPAEALGLAGVASVGAETPEQGVTQARAFLKALYTARKGRFIGGEGLEADIEAFRALPERQRKAIVGTRQEALMFMERVMDPEQWASMRDMFKAVKEAGEATRGEGLFGQLVAGVGEHPRLAVDAAERRGRARLALAEEARGIDERAQEAVIAEIKALYQHRWFGHRYPQDAFLEALDKLQVSPEGIVEEFRHFTGGDRSQYGAQLDAILRDIPDYKEEQRETNALLQELLDETRGQGATGVSPYPDR